MMVAGIGCRNGVAAAEVLAAVEAALAAHGLDPVALSALATTAFKRDEKGIAAAARRLGLPLLVVEDEASDGTLTRSDLSLAVAGSPSVSECAALGAAGGNARLLGPRLALGPVTCAIAESAP